ncbi:hypothetical protein SCUP234_06428 [Seiridium cupressi]
MMEISIYTSGLGFVSTVESISSLSPKKNWPLPASPNTAPGWQLRHYRLRVFGGCFRESWHHAPAYASPYVRMADDAACFNDPYFSSGVHLALTGGMSAAITVAASIRGNCDELQASSWHLRKVAEPYTRFLLVISSSLKQTRAGDDSVISD